MRVGAAVVLCILLIFSSALPAREVAGIDVAESARVGDVALDLNGAGVRWKFFFKIYVGALYLSGKADNPEAVYAQAGPKRIDMHILYNEISRDDLVEAWNDGFEGNLNSGELAALRSRIADFNRSFSDVKAGDQIRLEMAPATGTSVWIRGEQKATIPGDDFALALLKIWLGNSPADNGLKSAMLGG